MTENAETGSGKTYQENGTIGGWNECKNRKIKSIRVREKANVVYYRSGRIYSEGEGGKFVFWPKFM
jgi:hypothetical protein